MCEKMHIKICKSLLGIHRTSTNVAVLSELGRFPIHFDILKAMLSYWHRLENLDPDCSGLLKNAFVESKYLFHKKCPSWYRTLQAMVSDIQGVKYLPSIRSYKLKDTIKKILSEYYLKCWHSDWNLHSSKKLRCYCSFKTNFGFERYLSHVKKFEHRKNITRLRISPHRLQIERGRYQGIHKEERQCLRCDSSDIDDEKHFLFSCSHLNEEREKIYDDNNFSQLNPTKKLIWLMAVDNPDILTRISNMVQKANV
jgi:hypothetical protein